MLKIIRFKHMQLLLVVCIVQLKKLILFKQGNNYDTLASQLIFKKLGVNKG